LPYQGCLPLFYFSNFRFLYYLAQDFFYLFTRACLHLRTFSILDSDLANGFLWPSRKSSDRVAIAAGIEDIPWLSDHPSLENLNAIGEKAFILCNKKNKFFWADDDFRYNFDILKA
jgi:hypothetical protein